MSDSVKYPKPKILLIDLKDDSKDVLKSAGFKVENGKFGVPYRTQKSETYEPVVLDYDLPNFAEQEVVIIDLLPFTTKESPDQITEPVDGDYDYWAKKNFGVIDPRNSTMHQIHTSFDKIASHGGLFIIFADRRLPNTTCLATQTSRGLDIIREEIDNWSFLTPVGKERFNINSIDGLEITVSEKKNLLVDVIEAHLQDAHFTCNFEPLGHFESRARIYHNNEYYKRWVSLAFDKYSKPVAGVFVPDDEYKGWILILPQLKAKSSFLLDLLQNVFPQLQPQLFPYSENKAWIDRDEYKSRSILDMESRIETIKQEANKEITSIKEQIKAEGERFAYLNNLLTETDAQLVTAVKTAFEVIGFTQVIDLDEVLNEKGIANQNDEDLQILDDSMNILVEVKGITGFPKDSDVLQVLKHVPIRMREWDNTKVKALSVINHQRAIPALERENEKVFRDLILQSANEQHLGLLTTFELYRLVRNFLKNNWTHENIKNIFLNSGHLEIIPDHYQYVGKIENFWEKVGVVGIRVEGNAIRKGDRIAFELPIEFEEQSLDSLEVENTPVDIAEISHLAGTKTAYPKEVLKKNIRVFRVSK